MREINQKSLIANFGIVALGVLMCLGGNPAQAAHSDHLVSFRHNPGDPVIDKD